MLNDAYNYAMRWINGLDMQQWFIVLIVAFLLGLICMRGFGSRSKY